MDTFKSEITFSSQLPIVPDQQELLLTGLLRHYDKALVEIGSARGGSTLRLGYKICSKSEPQHPLFEDRAAFEDIQLAPNQLHQFRIALPAGLVRENDLILTIDFVQEGQFWFQQSGQEPALFTLALVENHEFTSLLIREVKDDRVFFDKDPALQTTERRYLKASPDLLPLVCVALRKLVDRFGFEVAMEFAYLFILGRRADPAGLREKLRDLRTGLVSLDRTCAEMLNSVEYMKRDIRSHRSPDSVLLSWALIDA